MKAENSIKNDSPVVQIIPLDNDIPDNSDGIGGPLYALIMAGGSGLRIGGDIPKQFVELAGIPVLMHTIQIFINFNSQIKIILVLPEYHVELWKQLCLKYEFKVPHLIVNGGRERFFSVKNGLDVIEEDGIVFIHDGVRPLISHHTINRCYHLALQKGNALPVISVSESVRFIETEKSKPIDRNKIKMVQTPQTFRVSLIKEAYKQPFNEKFTDDALVLEEMGYTINLTEGNRENIKITWPADMVWAEAVLKSK